MKRFNRELDVMSNIMEVNAADKKRNAWMKMYIPDDFATAVMKAMMIGENSPRPTLSDIKLCWYDAMGETRVKKRETLREMLSNDILDRYDNSEYWNMDESGDIDDNSFTEDILNRYDNVEYWNPDIVREFLDNALLITNDDLELASGLLEQDELIRLLASWRLVEDE